MRKRWERTAEEARADERHFAETRVVLEGGSRPANDAGSLKLFGFLFNGGCDAELSRDGFFVRFTWNPGPHSYYLALAPAILAHLLKLAGVECRCTDLRAAPLAPHGLKLLPSRRGVGEDRLFWLLDNGDQILFSMRLDTPELRGAHWPTPIVVPSNEAASRSFEPPRPCPHCAVPLAEVRDYGTFMVCRHCGRSFPSWSAD